MNLISKLNSIKSEGEQQEFVAKFKTALKPLEELFEWGEKELTFGQVKEIFSLSECSTSTILNFLKDREVIIYPRTYNYIFIDDRECPSKLPSLTLNLSDKFSFELEKISSNELSFEISSK